MERKETELPKVLKYKTKEGGATTEHPVAGVDLPLAGPLRTSAARGPRGSKVLSRAGSETGGSQARPGPYTPDSSEGRARSNRSSEERERREGGSRASGKGGTGAVAPRRTRPGPLSNSQMFSVGIPRLCQSEGSTGPSGAAVRTPVSSPAPRPRWDTHPGPLAANSQCIPRRRRWPGPRTPRFLLGPSPRSFALYPRGTASRDPAGSAAAEPATDRVARLGPRAL